MNYREFQRIVKTVDKLHDKVHSDNLEKLKRIEDYLNNEISKDNDYFRP